MADSPPVRADSSRNSVIDRLRVRLEPLRTHPVGRTVLTTAEECGRVELFDRAMTLAAQIFTSVFPILILVATFITRADWSDLSGSVALPPAMDDVLPAEDSPAASGTLGLVGLIFVLIAATSLSRALARMYAVVWRIPRPTASPRFWWRWLAVVVAFVLAMMVSASLIRLAQQLSPTPVWQFWFLTLCYGLTLLVSSYVLMVGRIPRRALAPGALLAGFAIAMVSYVGGALIEASLAVSAERYGLVGVAFTYLGFLYATGVAIVVGTVLGAVLVRDDTPVGRRLRGDWVPPGSAEVSRSPARTGP